MESTLKKQFKTFKANTEPELKTLLKNERIFCIVIGCNVREKEDITKVRKICSATPKIPCLMYGHASEQEFLFQLAKDGLDAFIPNANVELLLDKLHQFKDKATFRIDLRKFGIDLDMCGLLTRKFLRLLTRDQGFLRLSVRDAANRLGVTRVHLSRVATRDTSLSPGQLITGLRLLFSAYLLQIRPTCSAKEIALQVGFGKEHTFYASFHKNTGLTVQSFRKQKQWYDFPVLYVQNLERNGRKSR